jgi:hypothetical protein
LSFYNFAFCFFTPPPPLWTSKISTITNSSPININKNKTKTSKKLKHPKIKHKHDKHLTIKTQAILNIKTLGKHGKECLVARNKNSNN